MEYIMRSCGSCLELFQAKSYSKQKYCSLKCFGKINGKQNKNLKPKAKTEIKKSCKCCGRSEVNKMFCSEHCAVKFRHFMGYTLWLLGFNQRPPGNQTLYKYLLLLYGAKCAQCGIKTWNNLEIRFDVDHIDGNHTNDKPDNLRLICQNCHAQTATYKGKNKGNGRHARRLRYQANKSF